MRVPRVSRDVDADGRAALRAAGLTATEWEPIDVLDEPSGVRTISLRSRDTGEDATLKVATDANAATTLGRDSRGLARVREIAPPELVAVLPRPVDSGSGGSGPERTLWTLDARRPGVDARILAPDPHLRAVVARDLVARVTGLYRATATPVHITKDLPDLLALPLEVTDSLPTSRMRVRADESSLARLQAELRTDLEGSTVTASLVHGNLWLGNVVCAEADGQVTGIVDWERCRMDLPVVELMHLVCTSRALVEHRELGAVVRDVLAEACFRDEEAQLIATAPGADELSTRTAVLLMWLRHVHGYTRHTAGTRPSEVWVSHNVHQVLESV